MKNNETIKKEIETLESKISALKKELADRNSFTMMYMMKSGKHTFVMQPNSQKTNLLLNGWRIFTKEQMNAFLYDYEF